MGERVGETGDGVVLMIAGGGTGGHVYPAIAIAREWISRDATRRAVFVGTERGLETKIVPREGFPLELITVAGLKGKSPLTLVRNALKAPLGLIHSWGLLRKWKPAVVLGVGGYASGPALLAASLTGYPTAIHEQNAYPGLTNRILSKFVTKIAVAFPEAVERLGGGEKTEVTGNPVRQEFFDADAETKTSGKVRLLVFGGSQGSKVLNEAMVEMIPLLGDLESKLEIVHQTGPNMRDEVAEVYEREGLEDARVVAYLDPMADELRAADLVVARAGAMTLGELAATGRPSILVPFARATNNHQEVNARAMEAAGGAVVITENELSGGYLREQVATIALDRNRLSAMGKAAKGRAEPESGRKIVDIIEQIQRN